MKKDEASEPRYKDLITFNPETILFINEKQQKLAKEFHEIIRALREKNLTVKEIHKLFYDSETEKHTKTIKTIYRHLEKLEKGGLVAVAGSRMTEGSRIVEKLYCRTANIFFIYDLKKLEKWNTEESKTFTKKLSVLMSELLQTLEIDVTELHELIKTFAELEYKAQAELMEKTQNDKKLAELFSSSDIDDVNKLSEEAARWTTLLRNPEILERMKKAFDVKD